MPACRPCHGKGWAWLIRLSRPGDDDFAHAHVLWHAVPGISQKTLTNQLREMEQDGLITRTIHAEAPPRVEYRLSEKGRTLEPLLERMCQWGHAHAENFVLTHGQCGGSCD